MVDSVAVLPWAMPILDSNGDPVSGGSIEFFDAGTTDTREVFSTSDLSTTSLGVTVTLNAAGIPVNGSSVPIIIYTGSTDYKVIIKDSDSVTLFTFDDIKGAIDTSAFGTGSSVFSSEVDASAGNVTIVAGDAGKLKNLDCSGGDIDVTLISAVTATDGYIIGIRHNGTANEVRIATVSSQTIQVPGSAGSTGLALTGKGHTVWLISNGANWVVAWMTEPLISTDGGTIKIADRLTAPPASPEPGGRYILNGTPTGDWSAQAEHDIAESDGQGGWFFHTPPTNCGWLAYVQDETLYTSFQSSAWVDQSGMPGAQSSSIKMAIFEDQKTDGTDGGSASGSAGFIDRDLTTFVNSGEDNVITGASLSSNEFTLPAGTYLVMASSPFYLVDWCHIRIQSTTTSKVIYGSNEFVSTNVAASGITATAMGVLTLTGSEAFNLQYEVSTNRATDGLGVNTGSTGIVERYSRVTVVDLTSLQGETGAEGPQGPSGGGSPVALTSTTNSVAWDMSTGVDFEIDTLGENTTIANPTNVTVGKRGRVRIVQDGTGTRTVAWGANFVFAGGSAPTASTGAGDVDIFQYDCIDATTIWIEDHLNVS